MPFIEPSRREEFEAEGLGSLCRSIRDRVRSNQFFAGDLAFIIYALLQAACGSSSRYAARAAGMHDAMEGWLTWRRLNHDPAEDLAREKNGDIK